MSDKSTVLTLDNAHKFIGRRVNFYYRDSDRTKSPNDTGVISSVNSKYIFVLFTAGCTAQACYPEDLVLELDFG